MATQSGESPQALAEAETRDRDDSPAARHIRQKRTSPWQRLPQAYGRGNHAHAWPPSHAPATRGQPEPRDLSGDGEAPQGSQRPRPNPRPRVHPRGPGGRRAASHYDQGGADARGRGRGGPGARRAAGAPGKVLRGRERDRRAVDGTSRSAFLSDHDVDEDVVIQAFGRVRSDNDVEAEISARRQSSGHATERVLRIALEHQRELDPLLLRARGGA